MGDCSWTVLCFGGAYQAHARGRVPGCPVLTETHALGAPRATQPAAEADGWASGLPPDTDYVPLTQCPALVMTAVPEPVLVHAPTKPERLPELAPVVVPEVTPIVAVLLSVPAPEPLPPAPVLVPAPAPSRVLVVAPELPKPPKPEPKPKPKPEPPKPLHELLKSARQLLPVLKSTAKAAVRPVAKPATKPTRKGK